LKFKLGFFDLSNILRSDEGR